MKYIMLVADGMSDRPIKELNDKTPLEVARIPNMNFIAKEGITGLANNIPDGLTPASDVANMSLLGYDPLKYYNGRGPLEAANMGIHLKEEEVAFRCNLVTISEEKMADYSAGHITNKEARAVIKFVNRELGSDAVKFYPGISYRHLAVIDTEKARISKKDLIDTYCQPPHDIIDKPIVKYMPKGRYADLISEFMLKSRAILEQNDINKVRIDLRENPANMIWLWGQGAKADMPLFEKMYNLRGSIISAVDLIKGLGKIIGLEPLDVPGATGYYDTDYMAKAKYAIEALKRKDFVFVHVEAPDEAGHNGDLRQKIMAIENFDKLIVGTILDELRDKEPFRIAVLPDHATPIEVRTHTRDLVPFAIYGDGIDKDNVCQYNEIAVKESGLLLQKGYKLMDLLIKD